MCNNKKARLSRLARAILELLSQNPDEGYSLSGIADKVKLRHFNRESPARASLSRCMNNLHRKGLVEWFYHQEKHIEGDRTMSTPQKSLGKYWSIRTPKEN